MKGIGLIVLNFWIFYFTTVTPSEGQCQLPVSPYEQASIIFWMDHLYEKLLLNLAISAECANYKPLWQGAATTWKLDTDPQPDLGWGQLTVTLKWAAVWPRMQKKKTSVIATFQASHLYNLKHSSLASKATGFPRKNKWMLCVPIPFKPGATEAGTKWNSRNCKAFSF